MRKTVFSLLLFYFFITVIIVSCVPARQFDEIKAKRDSCDTENAQLRSEKQQLITKNTELSAIKETQSSKIEKLLKDSTDLSNKVKDVSLEYNQLNKSYDQLVEKNQQLLSGTSSETKKILSELSVTQDNLLKKEDALKKLERELNDKKLNLDDLSKKLNTTQVELEKREQKVNELQSVLNKKDSIVKALKNKVANALLNFQNKGLTIQQKNGKVYVSLDESLLFATGSTTVGTKGIEALKKLAKVLEQNPDINIMIEGHTDDVPYKGTGVIKDNWDLSVMRATAIVRIITTNSNIDPKRLSASGRGEYFPIDVAKTKEGKAKNRRTEIILTPKLDELFQIIENN